MESKISATIIADSINPQGNRLTSLLITFPRIILAEVNTHRMLSKNTSSSRAIPFKKMVEAVQIDPFIPIAWQKHHSGMQGSEYLTGYEHDISIKDWLNARDSAVSWAKDLYKHGVTKQLANRLLEPFMWTTMLITGSKEGWNNFFRLRCPQYYDGKQAHKSKIEYCKANNSDTSEYGKEYWQAVNEGQAEIHIMDLAEKIYDAMNESTPKQLKAGEWHIPFEDKIQEDDVLPVLYRIKATPSVLINYRVKISTAMAARTSYTVVGDEKEIDYQKQLELHDRLIFQEPPHSSPFEHCARVMSEKEYYSFIKGNFNQEIEIDVDGFIDISTHSNNSNSFGWCNNIKGFIPYRYMIDNNLKM